MLVSGLAGSLFFFKRSGVKRANFFFGLLLLGIGGTLLHNILYVTGFYDYQPAWRYLPIYFTLAIPVFLFYYVKLSLFPAYRLCRSDIKHFILPALQWAFFWWVLIQPTHDKANINREFFNPFYGGLEQAIYLVSFFAYLYFSYLYLRRRRAMLGTKIPMQHARQLWYIRKFIKALFVLFGIHTVFVLTDFFCYEFLLINLRAVRVYAGLGALSFAALVYFLGVYGWQVLLWGRKRLGGISKW